MAIQLSKCCILQAWLCSTNPCLYFLSGGLTDSNEAPALSERALRDGEIRIGKTSFLFGQYHLFCLCKITGGDRVQVHAARQSRCVKDHNVRTFRESFICERRNNFTKRI
jgi:hypothetical protein